MLLSGYTSFFIPNPNYLKPIFFFLHCSSGKYVLPIIWFFMWLKVIQIFSFYLSLKILILKIRWLLVQKFFNQMDIVCSHDFSVCTHPQVKTCLQPCWPLSWDPRVHRWNTFISMGDKERKTENEKAAHIQGQPHESASKKW